MMKHTSIYRPAIAAALALLFLGSAASLAEPVRILPLGDSITQGGKRDRAEYTYRWPLFVMLAEAGIDFDFVGSMDKGLHEDAEWPQQAVNGRTFDPDHEGHYGWKTARVLEVLPEWIPQWDAPPDIALIHLGTNDQGADDHGKAVVEPLKGIIRLLREQNPNVVVLLGHLNFNDGAALRIRPLVEAAAAEMSTEASPVLTVHHYQGWSEKPRQPGSDTFDWAHPNPQGQRKMAAAWFESMQPYLPEPEGAAAPDRARNVILMIGDGMGPEQVRAARLFAGTNLFFESFPHQGHAQTASADQPVTDSAASGTAMATGRKVNNGVLSMAIPGDESELETLLERFKAEGRDVGLVTTTCLTHATPAAFGAHEPSRNNSAQIAGDYLDQTRPNVLLGGGGKGLTNEAAEAAGYLVVTNRAGLQSIDLSRQKHLAGFFGDGHLPYELDGVGELPHLHEMVTAALDALEDNPLGFFLMVEGGRIDHAGHANDLPRNVRETLAFDRAVQAARSWAEGREDTLLLVTADHETGGLSVVADRGAGSEPEATWSTGGHTATPVPLYGWGRGAERVEEVVENTDIHEIIRAAAGP